MHLQQQLYYHPNYHIQRSSDMPQNHSNDAQEQQQDHGCSWPSFPTPARVQGVNQDYVRKYRPGMRTMATDIADNKTIYVEVSPGNAMRIVPYEIQRAEMERQMRMEVNHIDPMDLELGGIRAELSAPVARAGDYKPVATRAESRRSLVLRHFRFVSCLALFLGLVVAIVFAVVFDAKGLLRPK